MDSLFNWLSGLSALAVLIGLPIHAFWPRSREGSRAEAFLLGSLLAVPLYALLAHVFLFGLPINSQTTASLCLFSGAFWASYRRRSRSNHVGPALGPAESLVLYFAALASFLYALALLRYTIPGWDAAFYWVAKPWAFVNSGSARIFPYTHGPSYPLAVPFVNAFFFSLGSYMAAALWQHLFVAAALLYALLDLSRRRGAAGLALGALLFLPQLIFIPLAGSAYLLYADTTLAAALLVSCIFLSRLLDGDTSKLFPAALMLSFTALTKVNAGPYLVIVLSIFSFLAWRSRSIPPRHILLGIIPPLFLGGAWFLTVRVLHLDGSVANTAAESVFSDIFGSAHPFAVIRYRVGLSVGFFISALFSSGQRFFAYLSWIFLVVPISLVAWRKLEFSERFLALTSTALLFFIVLVMFSLVEAETAADADWWFRTAYLRAVIHVWPLFVFSSQFILARFAVSAFPTLASVRSPAFLSSRSNRIVIAIFPLLALPLLFRIGVPARGWERLMQLVPREETTVPNEYGLYWPESEHGLRVRWTTARVELPIRIQGDLLKIDYEIRHPDASEANPVSIDFQLGDLAHTKTTHAARGFFTQDISIPRDAPAVATLTISIAPAWIAPNVPERGIRLYPLRWE